MSKRLFSPANRRPCLDSLVRRLPLLLFLAVLVSPGCSGGKSKNKVSGTVTTGGKPVEGIVGFVGSDDKEYNAPIAAGKYTIDKIPTGTFKVYVKGIPGASKTKVGPAPTVPKDAAGTAMPGSTATPQGEPPPPKYASPDNGLTIEVKGGDQTENIDLK